MIADFNNKEHSITTKVIEVFDHALNFVKIENSQI
jgi:hypothetical protein